MSTENFNGISLDDLDDLVFAPNQEEIVEEENEEKNGKEEEESIETETSTEESTESTEENEEEVNTGDENPLLVITSHLHEKGIVDMPEDFDGTDESFEKLFENKIEKGIQEYKEGLNGTSKDFLDYLEAGGNPQTFIQVYAERDFSSVKETDITESDDVDEDTARNSIRKEIIKEALKMQGLSEEKINAKIQKYEDTGILADEASDLLPVLKKASEDKKKGLVEKQRLDAEKKKTDLANWIKTTGELIDSKLDDIVGVEVPKRQKDEFKDFLLKINPKTGRTALVEKRNADPTIDLKMAFAAFGGFETVKKSAKKEANTSLANKLKTGGKGLNVQPKKGGTNLWASVVED